MVGPAQGLSLLSFGFMPVFCLLKGYPAGPPTNQVPDSGREVQSGPAREVTAESDILVPVKLGLMLSVGDSFVSLL